MLQKPRLLVLGLFLSAGAYATSVTFNFNTLSSGAESGTGTQVQQTSLAIQNYMDGVLSAAGCSGCTVNVLTGNSTNGVSMGAVADQTYTGDGNVVGPVNSGVVDPVTLGTTNGATGNNGLTSTGSSAFNASGAYDTFIANTTDGSTQLSNQITLQFEGFAGKSLTISSFDYEIFPCGIAPPGGTCTPPDMVFEAGNGTDGVDSAVTSFGASGTQLGVTPGSGDGGETHSTVSGTSKTETSAQYIGTWTGSVTGATELDFIDWPATIGIDNLNISFSTPVPEPASIVLLGTLVVLLAKKLRRA